MAISIKPGIQRFAFLIAFMGILFFGISYTLTRFFNPYYLDYAAYWQAGRMILDGKDIYNSGQWLAERAFWKTALHSEPTFQYPLPFAILVTPFSMLSVMTGYAIWVFMSQAFIFVSLYIAIGKKFSQTPYKELAIVSTVFLFRPTYIVISNGQILSWLLLALMISVALYQRGWWFLGGVVLAMLSLKPSVGLSLLVLIGVWLLIQKRWQALAGLATGGIGLLLLGMIYDPDWAIRYITIGGDSVQKYYGMQATLWGLAGVLFDEPWNRWFGAGVALVFFVFILYGMVKTRSITDPFMAIATLIPAALLVSPYSWAYDQLMLIISAGYIFVQLDQKHKPAAFYGFLVGFVLIPFGLVLLAHRLGHDVWSLLNNAFVLGIMFYFYLGKLYTKDLLSS